MARVSAETRRGAEQAVHQVAELVENNWKEMAKNLPPKFQVWVDARKRFRLSHAHIQMARERGLNPKKPGSIANHDHEKWKCPLPRFIEELYFARFGKKRPESALSIEDLLKTKRSRTTIRAIEREARGEGDPQEPGADDDSECPI